MPRPLKTLALALPLMLATILPAAAATTVHVTLSDSGRGAAHATGMGMAMDGDMSKATMRVLADTTKAPTGDVTFEVSNASSTLVHEMLVVKVKDGARLPYEQERLRVDEDASGSLGEVSELDPGKSGTLTLHLDPGTYVLFCNIPGHFMAGMWTLLTVS